MVTKAPPENLNGRDYSEETGRNKMILKWILRKQG
jgi:hypothetical protein